MNLILAIRWHLELWTVLMVGSVVARGIKELSQVDNWQDSYADVRIYTGKMNT